MFHGFVMVITSPGVAYQQMEHVWLMGWAAHAPAGVALLLVDSGESTRLEAQHPNVVRLVVAGASGLIPGVLHKTHAALRLVHAQFPSSWVFRTNLSSHLRLTAVADLMGSCQAHGPTSIGYSPLNNHLSGAGFGMNPGAVGVLLGRWGEVDATKIDDVAMSGVLMRYTRVVWTGRLDIVWPDGVQALGVGPHYHVRVKTRDRLEDTRVLHNLACLV